MTGMELKRILARTGRQQKDIAALLGMSHQNFSAMLSVADVRTGLIERLCDVLELHPSFFYGGGENVTAVDHSVSINGGGNSVSVDGALVRVIERQSKQITDLIDLLAKQNKNVE